MILLHRFHTSKEKTLKDFIMGENTFGGRETGGYNSKIRAIRRTESENDFNKHVLKNLLKGRETNHKYMEIL